MSENGGEQQKVELFRDLTYRAYDSQVSYGRWVLASLVTIHGGALVLIAQAEKLAEPLLRQCGSALLVGLSSAVLTGGLAWINYSLAARGYALAWMALQGGKTYQPSRLHVWGSPVSMACAVVTTAISILAFVVAAYGALVVLNENPPQTVFEELLKQVSDFVLRMKHA